MNVGAIATIRRQVGPALAIGIFLLPIIFAWKLIQQGYSTKARCLAFGWMLLWTYAQLSGLARNRAETSADTKAVQAASSATPTAKAPPPANPTQKYMEAINREIAARQRDPYLNLSGEDPKTAIESAVVTFIAWGKLYKEGEVLRLNTSEEQKRQQFRKLAEQVQADAFPRMRKLQGQLWANAVWERDIDLTISGRQNSEVVLTGPLFFTRRTMKPFLGTIEATVHILRFKKVSFLPYRGGAGSYFTYSSLADSQLADMGTTAWQPIAR